MKERMGRLNQALRIEIPEALWEPVEGDAVLMGPPLLVNGVLHHVEAWQVTTGGDGDQHPAEVVSCEYEDLHGAVHADGSFETVRIGDHDYVVVISPYCC